MTTPPVSEEPKLEPGFAIDQMGDRWIIFERAGTGILWALGMDQEAGVPRIYGLYDGNEIITDATKPNAFRRLRSGSLAQEGWKVVPVKDTEEMWGGLARQIVMWRDMSPHTGAALYRHLKSSGWDAPAWLIELIPDTEHSPPKGAVAGAIYRAMISAAPTPPTDGEKS